MLGKGGCRFVSSWYEAVGGGGRKGPLLEAVKRQVLGCCCCRSLISLLGVITGMSGCLGLLAAVGVVMLLAYDLTASWSNCTKHF